MIADWLMTLGLQDVSDTRTGARARCPFHGSETQTLSIHGTRFVCFSAACGARGSLRKLAKHFGTTVPAWVLSHQELIVQYVEPEEIPLYTLATMPVANEFVSKRGLPTSVAEEWMLRVDDEHEGVLIPIFDHKGRYVSRIWRRYRGEPRYLNEPGMPREQLLYGLHSVLPGKRVALVEGCGDTWTPRLYGIPAVGTFGAAFCQGQLELLLRCGVTHVTIMYDNDYAGFVGAVHAFDLASDCVYIDFAMSYCGNHPKDPGSAYGVTLNRMYNNAESFADFWSRGVDKYKHEDLTSLGLV